MLVDDTRVPEGVLDTLLEDGVWLLVDETRVLEGVLEMLLEDGVWLVVELATDELEDELGHVSL